MALPYIHFPSRPKAKSRCQWLLLEYSSCLILWSGAKTAVTILLYLRQVKWNSKGHTSWTETSWQCYPTSKVSAKQLHLHFIQFSSANRSLSWRMFLIIVFFFVLMYHLRGRCSKGKGRGIWARGPARGRREERNSFLLPPFSRALYASRLPQIPFPFLFELLPRRLFRIILNLAVLKLWSHRVSLYRSNSHCTDSSPVVSHAVS